MDSMNSPMVRSFGNAFGNGYDESDFSIFEVLEDFDVCSVFSNPIFACDA